jgi:hypothetical protein
MKAYKLVAAALLVASVGLSAPASAHWGHRHCRTVWHHHHPVRHCW